LIKLISFFFYYTIMQQDNMKIHINHLKVTSDYFSGIHDKNTSVYQELIKNTPLNKKVPLDFGQIVRNANLKTGTQNYSGRQQQGGY